MDDQEYRITIEKIVADGKGYLAIRDISFLFLFYSRKTEYERDSCSAIIRLIRKLCNSGNTATNKVKDILHATEPEDKKTKDRIERSIFNSIRR